MVEWPRMDIDQSVIPLHVQQELEVRMNAHLVQGGTVKSFSRRVDELCADLIEKHSRVAKLSYETILRLARDPDLTLESDLAISARDKLRRWNRAKSGLPLYTITGEGADALVPLWTLPFDHKTAYYTRWALHVLTRGPATTATVVEDIWGLEKIFSSPNAGDFRKKAALYLSNLTKV